jgi:transcriptional regulator with XRE-family HTH domain
VAQVKMPVELVPPTFRREGRNRVARSRSTRAAHRLEGRRLAQLVGAKLGGDVRSARLARHGTQRELGIRVGLSDARISQIERGAAASVPLEIWFALSAALDLPLKVQFLRDAVADVADAGHLKLQDLMLLLGRLTGRGRAFELATKPAEPTYSIDVFLRDDELRVLFIVECWNTFGNVNASVRSTRRKIAEAEALAVAIGGDHGPYRVACVWVVRDTRANRGLIARYPDVFNAAFTASSRAWVNALTSKSIAPPQDTGLVWANVNATRLFPWQKAKP